MHQTRDCFVAPSGNQVVVFYCYVLVHAWCIRDTGVEQLLVNVAHRQRQLGPQITFGRILKLSDSFSIAIHQVHT